jgi:hypothetical protein
VKLTEPHEVIVVGSVEGLAEPGTLVIVAVLFVSVAAPPKFVVLVLGPIGTEVELEFANAI